MTAQARVDVDAFRYNVSRLTDMVAPSEVMLAVKADAYGHGMLPLARAALEAGATSLAVLEIPAAVALRESGVTAPLFAWLHGRDTDFAAAATAGIDLGVSSIWQLRAIEESQPVKPVRVHLKVDTGLHRNGASPTEWPALVETALELQRRSVVELCGAWSHLADASPDDDRFALSALHEALQVAAGLGARFKLVHLAASSAGIRMPEARLDLVRFGIAAYGISPFDDIDGRGLGLRPVMSLVTTVTGTTRGRATIGAGFGDGILASAVPGAHVWAGGARHPVIEVGADSSVIGASGLAGGDEVVVFGPGDAGEPTAEEWADWGGTIGDEVVTSVSARVERYYVER